MLGSRQKLSFSTCEVRAAVASSNDCEALGPGRSASSELSLVLEAGTEAKEEMCPLFLEGWQPCGVAGITDWQLQCFLT